MRRFDLPELLLSLGLVVAAGLLPGCQVPLTCANGLGDSPAPDGVTGVEEAMRTEFEAARAEGRREAAEEDPRLVELRAGWQARVERAHDRLDVVLGVGFAGGIPPRVVLRPFGDERVSYELRADVIEGHRRIVLHVNAEPILAGVEDADRLLLRALAAGLYEEASQRHGVIPPWFVHMASVAASGELEEELRGLQRRALDGDVEAVVVDPADSSAAVSTGIAALVLLSERGRPQDVRRLLMQVADGDEVGAVIARLAHQPDGAWVQPATLSFRTRLAALDPEPWRLLQRAEGAAAEAGRAGLLASLPDTVPDEIREELTVLKARAAADEGDYGAARELLATLGPKAPARLRDPAAALALRIRVESHQGGNAVLARRLALALDRDYPMSAAGRSLRERHPLLGMEEDPRGWLALMGKRIEADGTDSFELSTLERYARTLVLDHRAGAAERFLKALGARRDAPELVAVREAVRDANQDPTPAAVLRNAARVGGWRALRSESAAQGVRDGGSAGKPALRELLAGSKGDLRSAAVTLAIETLGAPEALALLRPLWRADPPLAVSDLGALFAAVPYDILQAELGAAGLTAVGVADGQTEWFKWTLDLATEWLESHPHFLQSIRDDRYAVRQAAFDALAGSTPDVATPTLIGHLIGDPAALLRRAAVRLAGRVGFRALVRRGLEDEAWLVREEATRALAQGEGRKALPTLLRLVQEDGSMQVRGAAALGLLRLAPEQDRVIDVLLTTQVDEDSRLRDAIAARLTETDAFTVARGIERGWARAVRREKPSSSYLFRTSMIFHRLAKVDLGYYPGASRQELRDMLGTIRTWLARRAPQGGRAAPEQARDQQVALGGGSLRR